MSSTDHARNDQPGDRPDRDRAEDDGRRIDPEPLDPEPLDPEPLDPEPLAIDSDDVNEFVNRYDDERTVDTDAPPT